MVLKKLEKLHNLVRDNGYIEPRKLETFEVFSKIESLFLNFLYFKLAKLCKTMYNTIYMSKMLINLHRRFSKCGTEMRNGLLEKQNI